jgi:hypothetical protein
MKADTQDGYVEGNNTHDLTASRLSPLQRWILDHAHQNRLAEHRDDLSRGADLYYKEVLAGFYGFPYEHYANPASDPLRASLANKRFKPYVIGRQKYNSACAAVSRAVTRLERRGLVVVLHGAYSHWAGVSLKSRDQKGRQ